MRRLTLIVCLAAPVFGAACAHVKPKPAPAPDYAAVQRRAQEAQADLENHGGSQAVSSAVLAPAAAPSSATILGQDALGCTWVLSTATIVAGDQDSRAQVRAEAISEARSFAMKSLLGVAVRSQDLVFQQDGLRGQQNLVENILRTTQLGRILKEDVISEGYGDAPGCPGCRYGVELKACIKPVPSYHDGNFRVNLDLSRTRLLDGDEDSLSVTCTEDCYVYVYDVAMDDSAQILVPNDLMAQAKISAGETWQYPDADLSREGVHLVAQLPPGQGVSAETLRVVAAKTPLTPQILDPSAGGYFGVLQRLDGSRIDWAEDSAVFTIYKQ